jgi:DNA-binding NtrC family response regulator
MAERTLKGHRILIVEDEYFIAADLQEALVDAGATVLGPLPTVAAATAFIDAGEHIDMAVLDVNLQGDPVFPVADKLQERRVPFAFVTGFDDWAIPGRFAQVPHLGKPQTAGKVLALLTSDQMSSKNLQS